MSRSAKDLRDIINVSRLSVHNDSTSTDGYSSEEIDVSVYSKEDSLVSYLNERPSSSLNGSSFATFCTGRNSISPSPTTQQTLKHAERPVTVPLQNNSISKNKQTIASGRRTVPVSTKDFPTKYSCIPPINNSKNVDHSNTAKSINLKNFDWMFEYLDGTIVNAWLQDLNKQLEYINKFMKKKQNFLVFADFFLTHLNSDKYKELIDLEFSIIFDQMKYAFNAGFNENVIKKCDVTDLLKAVLKEYPRRLKKEGTGPKLLLSIILVFCTGKDDTYRKLLRSINCVTNNKTNIQWLLAIRAFGLISFVVGILSFYENVLKIQDSSSEQILDNNTDNTNLSEISLEKVAIDAVKKDAMHVLSFLHTNTELDLKQVYDPKKRNLFFVSVVQGSFDCAEFLYQNSFDVNERSENGGFPLSYSVSKCEYETAEFLLQIGVDVNQWNEQCDGATPLHTAVMLGDTMMVKLLLSHGADVNAKMGVPANITPSAIAQEMNHIEIISLLKEKMGVKENTGIS